VFCEKAHGHELRRRPGVVARLAAGGPCALPQLTVVRRVRRPDRSLSSAARLVCDGACRSPSHLRRCHRTDASLRASSTIPAHAVPPPARYWGGGPPPAPGRRGCVPPRTPETGHPHPASSATLAAAPRVPAALTMLCRHPVVEWHIASAVSGVIDVDLFRVRGPRSRRRGPKAFDILGTSPGPSPSIPEVLTSGHCWSRTATWDPADHRRLRVTPSWRSPPPPPWHLNPPWPS